VIALIVCIAIAAFCAGFSAATWLVLRDDTPERSPETEEQLRALARQRERGEREHYPR